MKGLTETLMEVRKMFVLSKGRDRVKEERTVAE